MTPTAHQSHLSLGQLSPLLVVTESVSGGRDGQVLAALHHHGGLQPTRCLLGVRHVRIQRNVRYKIWTLWSSVARTARRSGASVSLAGTSPWAGVSRRPWARTGDTSTSGYRMTCWSRKTNYRVSTKLRGDHNFWCFSPNLPSWCRGR